VKGGENVLGFTEGLKVAGQFTLSDERERPLHGTAMRLQIACYDACAVAAEFAHFASELFPAFAQICFEASISSGVACSASEFDVLGKRS
jgi:hypothetical protein